MGGDETEARPVITDQKGISTDDSQNLYVTDSRAEVADLLGEGPIHGIVSGDYTYGGTLGQTGYGATGFTAWTATGIGGTQEESLGFLQSIYWNEVPVVDRGGYYNFANINVEYVKGTPIGSLPDLSSQLPNDIPANETLDLTVHRPIGERLYGISVQGGSEAAITGPIRWKIGGGYRWAGLPDDSRIDAVAKTYSILNKECTKLQVRIRVAGLFESIRSEDAPKTYEDSKELLKCRVASTGYGDTKARSIAYWIFNRPIFDERFIPIVTEGSTNEAGAKKIPWSNPIEETVHGKIDQVYVRNTTLDLSSDYRTQKGFQGWQIKIIRITPESLTSYLHNQTYVDSIVEVYGTKLRYPYSSMVYSKFNAEYFTRVPARSYDTKLLKIKIPNNYDPVKKTYGRSDAVIVTNDEWPVVTVSTRLRNQQQVGFQRGGAFYVSSSTPDIPYPALFKDATYSENTASLLHFDGANNATTTTSSTNPNYYNLSVTLAGSAKLSTTQKKIGTASLYINDTSNDSEVTIGAYNSFDWGYSSVISWGIECWVYTTSFSEYQMIFTHSGEAQYKGIHLQIQDNSGSDAGKIKLQVGGVDGTAQWIVNLLSSTALSTNTWTHVAAVRWGATFTIYIDGVGSGSVGSVSETVTAPTNVPYIGSYRDTGSQYLKGYIDEFRIMIGDAPYKANFTPSLVAFTNPYLITDYGSLDPTLSSVRTRETGATTSGFNNSTADDHFWDGDFKQIENWPTWSAYPEGDPQIVKKWSDNPAWCFYDLITNPRYGLGDYVESIQVDKWGLYEIAQYCDTLVSDGYGGMEPRFTMNHLLTSKEEAYKVINNLSSIFRGITYYANGLIFASQDSFKKALYQFNNTNVVDGMFTYASSAKKTRHSVAFVRYIDKRNHFRPSIEYVEDEEAIKRYGIREIQTTVLGCTSRGQARRFGLWLLASEYQETESVSFVVGQDGAYLKPGDVVQIYDQYRTPLKFGGRTNLVQGVGEAPEGAITYPEPVMVDGKYTLGGTEGRVTGNNIVIDNVLEFQENLVYKFSLLTPTYYYEPSQISNMNSSGVSEIRRTQIQDLYFLGKHALTVSGFYNSAYEEGGSGIATQIYFHTGLLLSDNTPVGTGNQLDFDNYVITGYTNNYVVGQDTLPPRPIEAAYSGGCFSGANLVWSLEPNDPTHQQFISGNFSNYRIINVGENDASAGTYNVAALEYSTGKYDEVESRLSFATASIDEVPLWPYTEIGGTYDSPANYFSIIKGHPNLLPEYDSPEEKFTDFPTMEVTFPQAGFRLDPTELVPDGTNIAYIVDAATTTPDSMSYLVCHHVAPITSAGFGILNSDFSDFGTDKTVIFQNVNYTSFQNNFSDKVLETVEGDINEENRYWLTNEEKDIEYENRGYGLLNAFKFEALLQQDANHWIAVFAVNNSTKSTRAVIGVIPAVNANLGSATQLRPNQLLSNEVYTRIEGNDIKLLTTEGVTEPVILNSLTSTQPSFTWINTVVAQTYDDLGNTLLFSDPYNDFRITIREHTSNAIDVSANILIEITGYTSDIGASNFTFLRQYNDPNTISSLPYNADVEGYNIKGTSLGNSTAAKQGANCAWFREDKTGIIFRNQPNSFPIRTFDIVVEAHDFFGSTSSKNKVWDNTIGQEGDVISQSSYAPDKKGYDIFGAHLAVPDSIVFAQEDIDKTLKGSAAGEVLELEYSDESWLTPGQTHTRQYPYCGRASLYNNGTLELSFSPSEDDAGNRILGENELKDKFSDVKGLVYYFTTGDNTLLDVREFDADGALGQVAFYPQNQAPEFEFEKKFIPDSLSLGFQGSVRYVDYEDIERTWEVAVGDMKGAPADVGQPWAQNAVGNNQTYRRYYIFPAGTNPEKVTIPFPRIAKSNVQNVFLNIGLFDSLSLAQHFESDRTTAKTETWEYLGTKTGKIRADGTAAPFPGEFGKELIPTIFFDSSFNFSTLPAAVYKQQGKVWVPLHWPQLTSGPKSSMDIYDSFLQKQGTPIFLKERSLETESQSALSYRAWFDISLDPGEVNPNVFSQSLTMDFDTKDDGTHVSYRGPFRLVNKDSYVPPYEVVKYSQKNKSKGFASISFEVKNVWNITNPWRLVSGYLTLYFDEEYDPQQYTVDVEFKQANYATAFNRLPQGYDPTGNKNPGMIVISDANRRDGLEKNINPNARDLIASDYPVENCSLVEKARGYIKFHLSPFYINAVNSRFALEMLSQEYEWVTEIWYHSTAATSKMKNFPDLMSANFQTDSIYNTAGHPYGFWFRMSADGNRKEAGRGFVRLTLPILHYHEWIETKTWHKEGGIQVYYNEYFTMRWDVTPTLENSATFHVTSALRHKTTKKILSWGVFKNASFNLWDSFWYGNDGVAELYLNAPTGGGETWLDAGPPSINKDETAKMLQLLAGEYLYGKGERNFNAGDDDGNPKAILGNIIKIKGGILLSDSFDKTGNTTL